MVAATVIAQYVRYGYWGFSTNDTFAGIETSVTVNGAAVPEITTLSKDLIVDGIGVMYTRAGGGVAITPMVQTSPTYHYLEDFVTVTSPDYKHWPSLNIPVSVQSGVAFIVLTVTTAEADILRLSMWGRYMPTPDIPVAPAPVTLDGITWPLRRRFP